MYLFCLLYVHSEDIERLAIAVFTLEYSLRLITAPNRLQWVKRILACNHVLILEEITNLIDVFAILPFYLELIISTASSSNANLSRLAVIRVIRLMRIFRLAKLGKYSSNLKVTFFPYYQSVLLGPC